jgi:hypothetical protein
MTAQPSHAGLAAGRWRTLSLLEQLANIGSEVDRVFHAAEQGRPDRRDQAFDRALELFDLTVNDGRWRGARRREVLRARELFCDAVLSDDVSPANRQSLSRYFLHFAVAARRPARGF